MHWQGDAASLSGCSDCPLGSPAPQGLHLGSRDGWDGPDALLHLGWWARAAGKLLAGCGLCRWELPVVGFPDAVPQDPLPALCLLSACLQLAVSLVPGTVVLHSLRHDPEVFYCMRPWVLPVQSCACLAR